MKHALAGFVAGALLAGLVLRVLARDDAAGPRVETPAKPAPPAAGEAPAGPAAGASLLEATHRLERLRAEVASLKASRDAGAADAGSDVAAKRSELAKLFLGNLDEYTRNRDLRLPANEEMSLRLQALIRRIAGELGIGLDEVGASPEGFAALVREALDGLDPKLDAESRAAVEGAIEAAGREWEAFVVERGGMTRLERGGKTAGMQIQLMSALEDRLDGRAETVVDALETLWDQSQPTWSGARTMYVFSSPQEAAAGWTESWSRDLKLSPTQKSALRPIVDDYVRSLGELKAGSGRDADKVAFELMVRAQHRMLDTLGLTPEQVEELQAQTCVYDYILREPK